MTDWLATIPATFALAVTMLSLLAIGFDLWTTRRKRSRRKIGVEVELRLDREVVASDVATELRTVFVTRFNQDQVLLEKLKNDLEKVAALAIMDDKIIYRTVQDVQNEFAMRVTEESAKIRLMNFITMWLANQDHIGKLSLPREIDALRGDYEYEKKREILGRELVKVIG